LNTLVLLLHLKKWVTEYTCPPAAPEQGGH
jgi:hypothetical protein